MKKLINKSFILAAACVGLYSCQEPEVNEVAKVQSMVEDASLIDTKSINPEAMEYYTNITTSILATGSNSLMLKDSYQDNPFVEKLENLEIYVDDSSSKISFYDLPEDAQKQFLNDWALLQAEQMSNKMKNDANIVERVTKQNDVIGSVLKEELVATRSGDVKIADNKAFFAKVQQRFEEQANNSEEVLTRSNASDSFEVPFDTFRSMIGGTAKRGDILVTLPKHGCTYIFYVGTKDRLKVGHAGVVTTNVSNNITPESIISIGAHTDGISEETAGYWSVQSYITGLQNVKWVWKRQGIFYRLVKETSPVSNPAALADSMKNFLGYEYVKWYEFATAKWSAPTRFTCTTLVWWCAKQTYGIDISPWWSPLVTPGDIINSEHTYIKREIP